MIASIVRMSPILEQNTYPVSPVSYQTRWGELYAPAQGLSRLLIIQAMRCAGPSRGWTPADPPAGPGSCPRHKRRASLNCRAALSGTVMATRSCPYTCSQPQSYQMHLLGPDTALL